METIRKEINSAGSRAKNAGRLLMGKIEQKFDFACTFFYLYVIIEIPITRILGE